MDMLGRLQWCFGRAYCCNGRRWRSRCFSQTIALVDLVATTVLVPTVAHSTTTAAGGKEH
jgi:hypothetical protein